MGETVDMIIMIQPLRGVIEIKVNVSAMIEVICWKNESCRVRRSIGLMARVFCA